MNTQRKTKNILFIDTSSNKEISVCLKINGKENVIKREIGTEKAQVVLPLTDKLLREHDLTLKDITEINVHTGPGSFTGLRVGIAIANSLGFALDLSVNRKRQIILPKYQ